MPLLVTACALLLLAGMASVAGARIARASGTFSFAPPASVGNFPAAASIAVGDLNGDGKPDLAVAGGPGLTTFLNTGGGTFAPGGGVPTPSPAVAVAVADMNGDGKADLVWAATGGQVGIAFGTGTGSFSPGPTITLPSGLTALAVGDLNRDGLPDVAVTDSNGTVYVLLNVGGGNLGAPTPYVIGGGSSNAIALLNLPVFPTPALAVAGGAGLTLLIPAGPGTFTLGPSSPLGAPGSALAVGDFNGDGKQDVAATNTNGAVDILLDIGNGLAPPVAYPAGAAQPTSIAAADIDGDGHLDLAIGSSSTPAVNILAGNGDGTFVAPVPFGSGVPANALAVGDFNGDGKPDLAVANSTSGAVSVLLNTSTPPPPTPTPTTPPPTPTPTAPPKPTPTPSGGGSTTTATLAVTGGNLSASTAAAPAVSDTLNGTDQSVPYTLPISLTDATGTGAGWNLTLTSTQFSTGGTTPHTLATTASLLTGASSACAANVTCTNPTNAVAYPIGVPAGATAPTAVKIFNAAAATGLGQFLVTPSVTIFIPANTYAGSYSSTLTLAVVAGP